MAIVVLVAWPLFGHEAITPLFETPLASVCSAAQERLIQMERRVGRMDGRMRCDESVGSGVVKLGVFSGICVWT